MNPPQNISNLLLTEIVSLISGARNRVAKTVNAELTLLYWNIGKKINEDILNNQRADYGKFVIENLSNELMEMYGTGYSKRNLRSFMRFNQIVPDYEIVETLSPQLSWSHIQSLTLIEDDIKREFYIQMTIHEKWSVRTMKERINSMLFERTAISKKPEETIIQDLEKLKNEKQISADLTFKDPYFLDFLGLKDTYSERDLESAILANLQSFLTEMGSEFAFIARQKRIIIDDEDYYIDLLFYHRGLRSLVAIELKLGKFKAQYKGQMELYLHWLEDNEQKPGENPPIGLILCSEKSKEQIKYMRLDDNHQIKVGEFAAQLPQKEILIDKMNKAIALAQNQFNNK